MLKINTFTYTLSCDRHTVRTLFCKRNNIFTAIFCGWLNTSSIVVQVMNVSRLMPMTLCAALTVIYEIGCYFWDRLNSLTRHTIKTSSHPHLLTPEPAETCPRRGEPKNQEVKEKSYFWHCPSWLGVNLNIAVRHFLTLHVIN